jgi:hypothetical protein
MSATKVTYYETTKTAACNIRLMLVRCIDSVKCYCLGVDRFGNKVPQYNSYYNINELKKINA